MTTIIICLLIPLILVCLIILLNNTSTKSKQSIIKKINNHSNLKYEYELLEYNLKLNNNIIHKRIYDKFRNGLMKIIEEENIKFTELDSIYELNNVTEEQVLNDINIKNNLACGLYIYISKEKLKKYDLIDLDWYNRKYPQIKVENTVIDDDLSYGNELIIAHELGHHFCIAQLNDKSEEGADYYVLTLAQKILTPLEIYTISILLRIKCKLTSEEFENMYNLDDIVSFDKFKEVNGDIYKLFEN
jgi:hypothetical protein